RALYATPSVPRCALYTGAQAWRRAPAVAGRGRGVRIDPGSARTEPATAVSAAAQLAAGGAEGARTAGANRKRGRRRGVRHRPRGRLILPIGCRALGEPSAVAREERAALPHTLQPQRGRLCHTAAMAAGQA